ncbi:hypothetical protein DPPLL_23650 [Desulfofustis limnaeus]|uniref:Uncharacterized protein n=1 Tax=Desulfofustis limnaeus TaxID=2740163 RepID=A0ABM7WAN2_9BACT|nr:hypothetical protein DPPLL_23650 [Desulfofustis limnaeus]
MHPFAINIRGQLTIDFDAPAQHLLHANPKRSVHPSPHRQVFIVENKIRKYFCRIRNNQLLFTLNELRGVEYLKLLFSESCLDPMLQIELPDSLKPSANFCLTALECITEFISLTFLVVNSVRPERAIFC